MKAQFCSGSLGDPVINMTFGSGHSFVMPPNITTYINTGGCPSKGQYVISNFLFGCGNHEWIQMIGDHTGDYNGNYMLVNAESTPGIVFKDTAKNLCENTNYVFSAWISNVMQNFTCGGHPVLANLSLKVKTLAGVMLDSVNTGDIPVAFDKIWKEYGFSFTTPPGVTSVIATIETQPLPGCGSGFVIDDIKLRPCGPAANITLDGNAGPGNVCADYTDPFILQTSYAGGFADPVMQWQQSSDSGKTWTDITGATTSSYPIPRRGTGVIVYRLTMAERANMNSLNCWIASNTIYTEIHPVPLHNAPANVLGCLDKDLHLPQADPSALSVLWSGPNGYTSDQPAAIVPQVQYRDTGLYTMKQNFYYGCTSVDTFYINIFPSTTISTSPTHPICEGASEQLSATSSGGGTYQWFPSTGLSNDAISNPIARPTDSTVYKVIVTNSFGCKDSASLTIDVYRKPFADAGPDRKINFGDSVTLNGNVSGTAIDFHWSPSSFINDIHSTIPNVYPPEDAIYTLTVNSTVGCGSFTSSATVKVYRDIYAPTAFTPNNDGRNDIYRIIAADNYKNFRLQIYNRWGQVVYETTDINKGWDGKVNGLVQASDVYVYYFEILTASNKKITKKGTLTLIR